MSKILAIVWLRYKLYRNGLRKGSGMANLFGAVFSTVVGVIMSLGVALVLGVLLVKTHAGENTQLVLALQAGTFFVAFFVGVIVPVVFESNSNPVTSQLLVFPISHRRLFGISQASQFGAADQVFYYPWLLTVLAIELITYGLGVLPIVAVLSVLLLVVIWSHSICLALESVLKVRRGKEIIAFSAVLLIITISIAPAFITNLLEDNSINDYPVLVTALESVTAMAQIMAPYQAAEALANLRAGNTVSALWNLAAVWIWIGLGFAGGLQMFARFYLGQKGRLSNIDRSKNYNTLATKVGSAHTKPNSDNTLGYKLQDYLPASVVAVAAKDWRFYMRSVNGKLVLILTPVMMAFMALVMFNDFGSSIPGLRSPELLFMGLLLYSAVFTIGMTINSLGWEGCGVQTYYLFPVSLKNVILGKNLALWTFQSLTLGLCLIALGLSGKIPSLTALVTGILFFYIINVGRTIMGNFLSILYPQKKTLLSRRDRPSQMASLLGFVGLIPVILYTWLFMSVALFFTAPYVQPLAMTVGLALMLFFYWQTLGKAADQLSERREVICQVLRTVDE